MSITVYSDIDQMPADVAGHMAFGAGRDFFTSLEWFRCLCRHGVSSERQPRIYVARPEGAQGMCVLFCLADEGARRLDSMTTYFSMDFAPVTAGEGDGAALLDSLLAFIAAERPRWRILNFRMMVDEAGRERMRAGLERHGFLVNSYFQFENYFEGGLGGDFEAYYDSRPSRVKNTIKRKERKLSKEHAVRIDLRRDFHEPIIDAYERIYALSWKDGEEFPRFIREMCRTAAELGILRMGVLHVDDVPAAAQLWLLSNGKAVIYKLAYDEAFRDYSVGSILTRDMMKYVIEGDNVGEIDYGIGSEHYKADWMTENRSIMGLEAFNMRNLAGILAGGIWYAGRTAKQILRSGR
jgi:ribosomal protein S18 acetylase RimI-like enzyme